MKLWFVDSGGPGVPIVLLHPNTGTCAVWEEQIVGFSRAGYRVIAFDRRGWGKSVPDPASGPQPGSIAGDLDALVDHLALDRFHLLGVAGGGFAALDYAAWRPERLRGLVVGASTGAIADKEIADFIERIAIPDIRKQIGALSGARAVLSRRQSGRHQALDRDRRACPSSGRRLPAAAPHAEHLGEDRNHTDRHAHHRRRCRSRWRRRL